LLDSQAARAKQNSIQQREDGGVGADSQRQRDYRYKRETTMLRETPKGVDQIPQNSHFRCWFCQFQYWY